eukprot:TRINITY_DN1890_c0_g1_i1.p1 TRINITY_DN1890_c0_g1~~TRINITY_DN1890_c0_g1_i1.p1  ORF type:complete len:138 (-),score=25.54 TRINITY_DN1890_c0_g1_i1:77-490(-)
MPVQPLIMGLALLFFIDNDSFERNHKEDRMSHVESMEALPCVPAQSGTSTISDVSVPGSLESPSDADEEDEEQNMPHSKSRQRPSLRSKLKSKEMKPTRSEEDVDASYLMDDYIVERKQVLTKDRKEEIKEDKKTEK